GVAHPGHPALRRPRRPALPRLGPDQPRTGAAGRRRDLGPGPARPVHPGLHPAPGVAPVAVAAHGTDGIGVGRACVAYLTLWLNTGAIAHFHVNWLSPVKVRTAIIGGSKRTLVWDDLNPTQRLAIFDRGVEVAYPDELGPEQRRDMLVSYRSGDMIAPALVEREALRTMVDEYARSIRSGAPALTDGRAGLRVLSVLEAASRSLADG